MEGQGDPSPCRRPADGPGRGLPHGDPFAALVLVGLQPLLPQPGGHVLDCFFPRLVEPVRVPGGAEPGPHKVSPFWAPARKGVSNAKRRKRNTVPNRMG